MTPDDHPATEETHHNYTEGTTMPTYVNRGYDLVFEPPYVADDVDFYGFILTADKDRLQELCDRTLNDPLGEPGAFSPAGDFLLLACCNLPSLRSTAPGYDQMGSYAEKEFAFWVPVIDHKRARLLWLFPYIWVDSPFAFAMGREIYGFPKGIGEMVIADDPKNPETFSLSAQGVTTFGPNAIGEMLDLVEVSKENSSDEKSHEVFENVGEMVQTIIDEMEDAYELFRHLRLTLHTIDDLLHLRIPMVFLKEFRDVESTADSCYQAVIETVSHATKVYGGRIYRNDFEITINPCDSAPIARDLGLPTGTIKPMLSFYMNFDFEIGAGTTVT